MMGMGALVSDVDTFLVGLFFGLISGVMLSVKVLGSDDR